MADGRCSHGTALAGPVFRTIGSLFIKPAEPSRAEQGSARSIVMASVATFLLAALSLVFVSTICSAQCSYMVNVYTGDREGAGTDADVYLRLESQGGQSLNFQLNRPGNIFERDGVDNFVGNNACVGRICKAEVTQNGKYPESSWYVRGLDVAVKQQRNGKCISKESFTIDQWVKDPVNQNGKIKYHWVPASNCGRAPDPNPRC